VCIVQAAPILISSIVHNLTLAMSPPACAQFERGKSFDIDEFLHEVTIFIQECRKSRLRFLGFLGVPELEQVFQSE
jgi:hypothetical protein